MSPAPPADVSPLRIVVLGARARDLREAVGQALSHRLEGAPGSRPLRWLDDLQPVESGEAELCWLQAWDERSQPDPDSSLAELQAHNRMRHILHARGQPYQVLRGSLEEQQAQALQSLLPWLPELRGRLPQTGVSSRRPGWSCGKCGDPDCEHLSLSALIRERGQG